MKSTKKKKEDSAKVQAFQKEIHAALSRAFARQYPALKRKGRKQELFWKLAERSIRWIAREAEVSYALTLKLRKTKDMKKYNALYEPYRKRIYNPDDFGRMVRRYSKTVKDIDVVFNLDMLVWRRLKKYFPALATGKGDTYIPAYGLHGYQLMMELCIKAHSVR